MIYREPKLWKDAVSSCRKEEGDLASIHDIEEHSFAVSQLGYGKCFSCFYISTVTVIHFAVLAIIVT